MADDVRRPGEAFAIGGSRRASADDLARLEDQLRSWQARVQELSAGFGAPARSEIDQWHRTLPEQMASFEQSLDDDASLPQTDGSELEDTLNSLRFGPSD